MKTIDQFSFGYIDSPSWEGVSNINKVLVNEDFYEGKEIHIWKISLESLFPQYQNLSIEEQNIANRYKNTLNKNQYIKSHNILRNLLASYLGVDSLALQFQRTQYGKPFVKSHRNFQFNMSHSNNFACFIFSYNNEVGIDIEIINNSFEFNDLIETYFSPEEHRYLNSLLLEERVKEFFRLWTLKEALLKAIGTGLYGLNIFSKNINNFTNKYSIVSFDSRDKYKASFAIKSKDFLPRYFQLLKDSND